MKYIYLLLFIGITSHCYAWSPTYKTNDRATNYNFDDLSTAVVDNYSKQYIGGKKTFSDSVTFSSMTVTDATINNAGISDLSVTAMSATQINVSSVTASGEITTGYGYYHDRGDPVVYDFNKSTITIDDNWHDISFSTFVPVGAKTLLLRIAIQNTSSNPQGIHFRKNGNTGIYNNSSAMTTIADRTMQSDVIVSCDENRTIEYMVNNTGTWGAIEITVAGWWK